jgi:hypothetical protein
MKIILSIIFLFFFQDQPLLKKIKADADYLVYMDTQIRIRDGFRSKRFVFPPNAADLLKNELKSVVEEQAWVDIFKKAGMVNAEEYVKLHFLTVTSMGKVLSKFNSELSKLPTEKKMELFMELVKLPPAPIPDVY